MITVEITTEKAMDVLREAMQEDDGYAISWQANIAMALYDEIGSRMPHYKKIELCNQAAGRFMELAFNVDGYALWNSGPRMANSCEADPESMVK